MAEHSTDGPKRPRTNVQPLAAKIIPPLLLLLFCVGLPNDFRLAAAVLFILWLAWAYPHSFARFWKAFSWPIRAFVGIAVAIGAVYLAAGIHHQNQVDRYAREIKDAGARIAAVDGILGGAHVCRVFFPSGAKNAEIERFTRMKGLDQLDMLVLEDADVTDEGLACLAHLPHLKALSLKNTRITDADLVHLAALRHLEFLDLEGTRISDKGLQHLQGLPIRTLFVEGTAVTDDGRRELMK